MAQATTAKFTYQVRDGAGKLISGELEADNQGAVAQKLRSMGYAPLKIEKIKEGGLSRELQIPG
ncbi:MAG TPA: hypothetical protein VGA36_09495 [Nitriliruptorales bacterium]